MAVGSDGPRIPIPGVGAHARDRMAERLGRDLTREEWLAAVAAIVDRRMVLLCVAPNGSEHYLHQVGQVQMRLVWRVDLGMVVTVAPPDWSPARVVAGVKAGGLRTSLRLFAHYRGGKRRPERTQWREDA